MGDSIDTKDQTRVICWQTEQTE